MSCMGMDFRVNTVIANDARGAEWESTHAVARELTVDAHECEGEGAPARVGGGDERRVVPDGLHRADLYHLLELLQLELDQRVRLAVV